MYGSKRKKSSYGTVLKYDAMHRGEEDEESGFKSRSFRSTRSKRFEFEQQNKKDFQDDEDLINELSHLKLTSNYKDLTTALDFELKEFEKASSSSTNNIPSAGGALKKSKKKKIKLKYHYEEELEDDTPEFKLKLKSVDSKLKFQKNLPRQTTTTKQTTDAIYKRFIKKIQPSTPKITNEVPEGFVSIYQLVHSDSAPLSKYAATSLLASRFTSSPATSLSKKVEPQQRIVQKIEVSDLLKKRLGI